jgi:hypothetical protein
MDGEGRWVDNVFVEQRWRSVKYEQVYLPPTARSARLIALSEYFAFYNRIRRQKWPHSLRQPEWVADEITTIVYPQPITNRIPSGLARATPGTR